MNIELCGRGIKLTVTLVATLLGGCATTVPGYSGPPRPPETLAALLSVGDIGFRIDRTIYNQKPAAFLMSVDGKQVGNQRTGFPTKTMVVPGPAQIRIHCALPTSAEQRARPGVYHTYAEISIKETFEAGKTYALRCEPVGGGLNRAWVELLTQPSTAP